MKARYLSICFLFLYSSNLFANPALIQEAIDKKLHEQKAWLHLLRYEKNLIGGGYDSAVISPQFFLSPDGKTNPENELKATLQAFFQPLSQDQNQHPQCQFRGRYTWLKRHLNFETSEMPTAHCSDFEQWSFNGKVDSLSLIFITGYLGNPSSYYGHIALKLNSKEEKGPLSYQLLDLTLTYGAAVPKSDNAAFYILKGLFGGYEAGFSTKEFYSLNYNYVQNELRDLWEYHLDLEKEDVELIVADSWEMMGERIRYYFLKDNCAYRMADLIELVLEEPLTVRQSPWVSPYNVFDSLVQQQYKSRKLVDRISYLSSRKNQFHFKYELLNQNEKDLFIEIVHQIDFLKDPRFVQLASETKIKVIETLFDYYAYLQAEDHENENYKIINQKLLQARISLPAGKTPEKPFEALPPHQGQKPLMVQNGLLSHSNLGTGYLFSIRPAYYDYLALEVGRPANSRLAMADTKVIFLNDRFFLKKLDLIHIETLNTFSNPVPEGESWAWKLRTGFEAQDLRFLDHLVFHAEGGIGKGFYFSPALTFFAMLDGRLQSDSPLGSSLALTPRTGMLLTLFPELWKSYLSVGNRYFLNGSSPTEGIISFENRFGNSQTMDFRINYEMNAASELEAAFSLYW